MVYVATLANDVQQISVDSLLFPFWITSIKNNSGLINFVLYDLSIGSTETKYIKLNTKTQTIFGCVNENLTTFLYTLIGGTREQKEKKSFLFESVYKSQTLLFFKSGFSI